MKTIKLKLEQVKKSKNGNSLISLTTKAIEFNDNSEALKICETFVKSIGESLQAAREMGANGVKVGGVNFNFNSKFVLYVNIDGNDFCLDDVANAWGNADKTENSFKNSKAFFVNMYQILRSIEGKSILLTSEASKQAAKLLTK